MPSSTCPEKLRRGKRFLSSRTRPSSWGRTTPPTRWPVLVRASCSREMAATRSSSAVRNMCSDEQATCCQRVFSTPSTRRTSARPRSTTSRLCRICRNHGRLAESSHGRPLRIGSLSVSTRGLLERWAARAVASCPLACPGLVSALPPPTRRPTHPLRNLPTHAQDPLSREFIPSLTAKEESLLEEARKREDASFIQVMDKEGLRKMEAEASQQTKLAADFAQLESWARHGKYREIEDAMNQPDWSLPIDFQDEIGNTLLHVCAQNGNKRIAKLCLRRGASIATQNLNGQTVLHYCFSYGFSELGEYFITKGADDSVRNADGLTCYEGLDMDDVNNI